MDARTIPQGKTLGKRSLLPPRLRERLIVGFCLMSVVPLLVLGYVVTNYVFPNLDALWDISLIILISVALAFLGFVVMRSLVLPVIHLASQAQAIASGRVDRTVDVQDPGEVGDLGRALNQITKRVKENMTELRLYGEKTNELNLEINQRIMALSNVLQISNLITQSAPAEEVITFILGKLSHLEEAELNCLIGRTEEEGSVVIRAAVGFHPRQAEALLGKTFPAPWIQDVFLNQTVLVVDQEHAGGKAGKPLQELLGMKNMICQPIRAMGQGSCLLISGNSKDSFVFEEDALDMFRVFAKQMAITIENDLLIKRAEKLEIMDELTGLYNAAYMKRRLDEEIRRAVRYHRSCALVVVNVDDFRHYQECCGAMRGEKMLKRIAHALSSCVTEVDRVGRMALDEFALVLPERNKREAMEMAELIRSKLQSELAEHTERSNEARVTVSAGVSENPIDGSTGLELFRKAMEGVKAAKREGKNRVMTA